MGRKRQLRSKPKPGRTNDKICEQSWNVTKTQENIAGKKSNCFTITDVRSLSEQNSDYYDLIPVKKDQDEDVPCSTYPDKHDNFSVNQSELPFISQWNSDNIVNLSQPLTILYNCIPAQLIDAANLIEAPTIMNNDYSPGYFSETLGKSVAAKHENIVNNSTAAVINEETNSHTTEKHPVVVLDDISNLLNSNNIVDTDSTNDELILFENNLTKHLRQLPLRDALILQGEILDIITLERLKCMET